MNWLPEELILDQDTLVQALVIAGDYDPQKALEIYDFQKQCLEQAGQMDAPMRMPAGAQYFSEYCGAAAQHTVRRD